MLWGDRHLTLNDRKSAEHEKWECLEDYRRRFKQAEILCRIGAKTADAAADDDDDNQECQRIIDRHQTEPDLLYRIITGDET